ncbi:MAG: AMP-binding protein [Prevotella sp.]|nr:AMP-binding protein [Prevotella sp.]
MTLDEFLAEWRNDNERVLVHTSGSTGKPKPLWVEKRRMEASARMTCDFLGLHESDTALLCLPLDYIAGKMMVVRSLVRNLRLIAVEPSGHPLVSIHSPISSLLSPLSSIHFAAMIPLQVWNSLQVPEERERLRTIQHLIIGGGAIDENLEAALQDFPHAVWCTYGMTETLSHIALRRLNGPERSEWYQPFEGVSLQQDAEGCLIIDAPHVGAHQLVTNDIAVLDDHGRFRILGRRDNVICSAGVKIQIEEVERLLKPHLSIPFMITKQKDQRLGEAVVMLHEAADGDTLREICQSVLPKYWQPRHYLQVDQLPTTPNGKPARAEAQRIAEN